VQFDTITPFLLVVVGLGSTQFIIGNIVEPIFMGRSLNLSSFMILASLMFWGAVWGVPGMILSVPIMVTAAIICSHIPGMQWAAIFLSADGRLMGTQEPPD
jgi:AI-2 transport protein TqsA